MGELGLKRAFLWIQPLSRLITSTSLPLIASILDFIQVLSSNGVSCAQARYALGESLFAIRFWLKSIGFPRSGLRGGYGKAGREAN